MLKLLRKIRRSLIESGSASRYLLYAIGEIALVVIGILIALQINNWNEWRKERIQEKNVLEVMRNTLQSNIDLTNAHLNHIKWLERSGNIIRSLMDACDLSADTLFRHFHFALMNGAKLRFSEVGYEHLRITNGEIIQNRTVRNELIHLYEIRYRMLYERLDWGNQDNPEYHPFIDEHFKRTAQSTLIPFNAEEICNSRIFISLISKAMAQRKHFSDQIGLTKEETQRVLQLIKEELGE